MISDILVALAVLRPSPTVHPLEGVWAITYPWHLEVENGVVKPVMETGELRVEARGDSLIATLVTARTTEYSPTRTMRLATGLETEEAVFVKRDPVSFTMGAEQRQAIAVSTWRFTVEGDRLRGSLERKLEGISQGHGPQALSGIRVGSGP